jgi:hypothetical protein
MNRKTILAPQPAFKARHATLLASVSALAGWGSPRPPLPRRSPAPWRRKPISRGFPDWR